MAQTNYTKRALDKSAQDAERGKARAAEVELERKKSAPKRAGFPAPPSRTQAGATALQEIVAGNQVMRTSPQPPPLPAAPGSGMNTTEEDGERIFGN